MGASPADITLEAPAKINLALHVTARRPDGYHDLDTLVVFADIGDRLVVAPGDGLSLTVTGPFADGVPAGPDNLVLIVAEDLRRTGNIGAGASIRLEKYLPSGAGIGGGSADAAAALKALNALWNAGLAVQDLGEIGLRAGADIPICLHSSGLLSSDGQGRTLSWTGAPQLPMVLVWPSRPVSTAAVFAALGSASNAPLSGFDPGQLGDVGSVVEYLRQTRNDLTGPAIAIEPAISDVLDTLDACPGCLLSRMSGSGSTCFGLFADRAGADAAAAAISKDRPAWWVRSTVAR